MNNVDIFGRELKGIIKDALLDRHFKKMSYAANKVIQSLGLKGWHLGSWEFIDDPMPLPIVNVTAIKIIKGKHSRIKVFQLRIDNQGVVKYQQIKDYFDQDCT